MEAIIAIIVMGVFVGGTFFGAFALSYLWVRHERGKWEAAASALGLGLAPNPGYHGLFNPFYRQKMVGHRGGIPIEIAARVVITGSGKNRSKTYYTYARVPLPNSLDLGISVQPRGMLGRAFDALTGGASDIQVGIPDLDPHYTIRGAEPPMVQRLLQVPYLAEALIALRGAVFKPQITDGTVVCERRGKSFSPSALGIALDSAVDVARRVVAAKAEIGPSSAEYAVDTTWRRVAENRGMILDLARTAMHGRLDGMHVEVDTRLERGQRVTEFTVRFDRPLGVGLQLTRQGGLSGIGKLFGMQDIEVGDPVFDARFVVKGSPEASVRTLLTPDVCRRLVDLQAHSSVLEVADDCLRARVGWLVVEPAWLESGMAAVAAAGAALAQVSGTAAGPYRR